MIGRIPIIIDRITILHYWLYVISHVQINKSINSDFPILVTFTIQKADFQINILIHIMIVTYGPDRETRQSLGLRIIPPYTVHPRRNPTTQIARVVYASGFITRLPSRCVASALAVRNQTPRERYADHQTHGTFIGGHAGANK